MHHVNFGRGGSQGKGIMAVGRGAAHDIMRGGSSLSQQNQHHGDTGLLNRINQRLSKPQQFGFLGDIAHIDAAGILKPDDGDPIPAAMRDKLIHFYESLAVEFAADSRIISIFGIILAEKPLAVTDDAYQKSVHLDQPRIDLGTIIRPILHMFAAVNQTRQDFVKIIHGFLIKGYQVIEIFLRKSRFFGFGHAEKFGIIGRHVFHIFLDAV